MIQFTRLRINGFKSFVDRSELEIAPGLSGIVGPNGCGKSNLVEALRWVMGESSAKRMRGGGMEDVIFNGTTRRTARNIAEVSLLLDNSARTAPAAYNNSDEIEIIRKIERDRGSNYKINGKNVRARDVQMLFADTVTGANSPALVSQGQITRIINSKPLERRLILEESAGISGLFARRHEAELRLKGADRNLVRIEDILGSMENRLGGLKRQARQASRYKNVSAQIRQLEILLAHLEWKNLDERTNSTRRKFEEYESFVAQKMIAVTSLTKKQEEQMQELPSLRQEETRISATLQTNNINLQRIEDETTRIEETIQESKEQLSQARTDETHEKQVLDECAITLEKMENEQKSLLAKQENEEDKTKEKQKIKDLLEKKVTALEDQYTSLMQGEAETKARSEALEQQIKQNSERLETVKTRQKKALDDLEGFKKEGNSESKITKQELKIKSLEDASSKLNHKIEALKQNLKTTQDKINVSRATLGKTESRKSEFNAEINMLESFFSEDAGKLHIPVIDKITTDTGFEKALSRALGDALLASLEDSAPVKWISKKSPVNMPELPKDVESLLPHVNAPKELHIALGQIGIVKNEETGNLQAENLLPGQSLVSPAGTYWRWDGYHIMAEASDQNAIRLEQKNKLGELRKHAPQIENNVKKASIELEILMLDLSNLEKKQTDLEDNIKTTDENLTAARNVFADLREKQARVNSETQHLKDAINIADEDIQTLGEVVSWDQERLQSCKAAASKKQEHDTEQLHRILSETRQDHQSAMLAFDKYRQEQSSRKARLHAITDERINLKNRHIRSREHIKQLQSRQAVLTKKRQDLEICPEEFSAGREALLENISKLEKLRTESAEKLAAKEQEANQTGTALKEAERELGQARENRASEQATLSAVHEQQTALEQNIHEQFNMAPNQLPQHLAMKVEYSLDTLETARAQKDTLLRERDAIGPVNLRADDEALELENEVTTLIHERNDLMQAIDELRSGISKINREARQRLRSAFEHVNSHFQQLFVRLYGGGKAHLSLIDSDDPLGAGLEIFAQPPGKTLQSLSLLSGGEQTLASIALIFAMFLTNPSPICVLDEIDAPLDDANVDRVCDLLEEIAERGETRFMIVTHHRLTMARMDRLYGITMAEKGISQLVSVDLQQSFEFLEEAA